MQIARSIKLSYNGGDDTNIIFIMHVKKLMLKEMLHVS